MSYQLFFMAHAFNVSKVFCSFSFNQENVYVLFESPSPILSPYYVICGFAVDEKDQFLDSLHVMPM